MVRKIVPGGPEPRPQITARLPYEMYKTVRELAIKHDVTIGEAFELLLDKIRIEAEERANEEIKKWKRKYEEVKKERDACKKELEELSELLNEYTAKAAKRTGKEDRGTRGKARSS